MRFRTVVIIPETISDIVSVVEQMMRIYDVVRPVLSYRVEITMDDIELFLVQQGTSLEDPLFCEKLSDWWGYPCDYDEQGYYCLSSDNPRGHWDGWILHDVQRDVYRLPDTSIGNSDPLAIVTPDGAWHEMTYRCDETTQQTAQRRLFVEQLCARYLAHLAVLLDCHR